MSYTRRRFLTLTTTIGAGVALPDFAHGNFDGQGTVSLSDFVSSRLLYKSLSDPTKLPMAQSCLICRNSIETIGGHRMLSSIYRGTKLTSKPDDHIPDNLREQIRVFEGSELHLRFWGDEQFMTEQVIERAKSAYLKGRQPWFCQKCGGRACRLCGTPWGWIGLAYGDRVVIDGNHCLRGANLGVSPRCENNPKCKRHLSYFGDLDDEGDTG